MHRLAFAVSHSLSKFTPFDNILEHVCLTNTHEYVHVYPSTHENQNMACALAPTCSSMFMADICIIRASYVQYVSISMITEALTYSNDHACFQPHIMWGYQSDRRELQTAVRHTDTQFPSMDLIHLPGLLMS